MTYFKEKLKTVQFAGKKNARTNWDKDMSAYSRMRKEGLQPPQIDGCADLETKATTKFEVEVGRVLTKEQMAEARKNIDQAQDVRMGLA